MPASPDESIPTTPRASDAPDTASGQTRPGSPPPNSVTEAIPLASSADLPELAGYSGCRELARGGMGVVYIARQTSLDREVAIKTLLTGQLDNDLSRRFVTESLITARLQHPAIPPVFQVGTLSDERPYMVMKLIRGRNLRELLKERPSPAHDLPQFLAAFEQVCQAVGFAHSRGVIHRDLKPSNVMIGAFGETLVMDWGLARATAGVGKADPSSSFVLPPQVDQTQAGRPLGTPSYMAPEQARGEWDRVGPRADVFALGGILADILTGRPPFVAETAFNTLMLAGTGAVEEAFARLDASGADAELIALTKQALSPKAEGRPADGKALADAVAAYRAGVEARLRKAEAARAAEAAKAAAESRAKLAAEQARQAAEARAEAEAEAKQAAEDRAAEATRRVKAELARAQEQRKRRRMQMLLLATVALLLFVMGAFGWWHDRQATQREAERKTQDAIAEAERKAAAERGRDAARAALNLAVALRAQQKYREATDAVAQAEKAAAGLNDLLPLVQREKAAIAFARDLDAVRARKWTWVSNDSGDGGHFNIDSAPEEYAAAFAAHGFAIARGDSAALARRIKESPIQNEILRALDDWALTVEDKDRETAERVWDVAFRAGPPDGLATKLRDPAVRRDRKQLSKLIESADDVAVSASATLYVAHFFDRLNRDPRILLEVAQAKHPTDFDITFALAMNHHTRINKAGLPSDKREYHRNQAVSHYRMALALRPDHATVLTNLGLLLGDKGEFIVAAAVLREAIMFHPNDHVAHFNLGGVLHAMKRLDEAEKEYRETIRLSPKYGAAYSNLGAILGNRGRHREAADLLAKAVDLMPDEPVIRSNYGLALQRNRDFDGALREYRKAIDLDPNYATGHLNIGALMEIKKDFAEAEKALREAARLDPKQYGPVLDAFLKRHPPQK